MAKFALDTMMDAALSTITANVIQIAVTSGQPADYDSAITQKGAGGQMLAKTTVSAGSFAALANGDASGRKLRINSHAGITVSATGGGNHVALLSSTGASTLWYVTTATSQTLTATNTLTIGLWDIEIADPT